MPNDIDDIWQVFLNEDQSSEILRNSILKLLSSYIEYLPLNYEIFLKITTLQLVYN